jgi:hypothetical protein
MKKTKSPRDSTLMTIEEFMDSMGMSRAQYYRMLARNLPLFPQRVYPNGPGTHTAKLVRKEAQAYLDSLTRVRDGKRPVGRPPKQPAA